MCLDPTVTPAAALSRRRFLANGTATVASVAALGVLPQALHGADLRAADGAALFAPSPTTPAEALAALHDGNRRFVDGKTIAPHRDFARLREIAPKQAPFAAFLGCADSRVPIEIVFDQGFGDLFVSRIAGNIAVAEQIASLGFATAVLGAKVRSVLGHTSCGAVSATMTGAEFPRQISALYFNIRPATRAVISKLVKEQKLLVAGGVYDLDTGKVTAVELGD